MPSIDVDPRDVHLSPHFRLSDFLGNHSVYAKGFANPFVYDDDAGYKLRNATALCENGLEPILRRFGPVSIAYGYISPDFSRRTVKYQDPDKPSHHRWDLGAAADLLSHRWVQGLPNTPAIQQLFANHLTRTSPALLAHVIDSELCVPYSRLITYSESPYVCLALSDAEIQSGEPRLAFYENRHTGKSREKPEYIQQPSAVQRARVSGWLQETGFDRPWEGKGYPTYHGGGIQQYQHMRVSKYTTVLDWLFNLKSISEGHRNIPPVLSGPVQDSFASAGILYDLLIDKCGFARMSILKGYTCRTHPDFSSRSDWRMEDIDFEVAYGQGGEAHDSLFSAAKMALPGYVNVSKTRRGIQLSFNVFRVLEDQDLLEWAHV